jgi:hypothetical protein
MAKQTPLIDESDEKEIGTSLDKDQGVSSPGKMFGKRCVVGIPDLLMGRIHESVPICTPQ